MSNVEDVEISATVTEIGRNAFSAREKLKFVTIPDSVKTIETGCFNFYTRLKAIVFPDGIEEIGENDITYSAITSLTISKSVTQMARLTKNCVNLNRIDVESSKRKL